MRSLGQKIADKELKVSTLEGDLRIEREWRQSLQDTSVKDKEKISELLMELQKWRLRGVVIKNTTESKIQQWFPFN
jgi:RUN and FYVE domain-containing protein 1